MSSPRIVVAFLGAAALALAASEAHAGDVSLRAGAYTDVDGAFVGIEYRTVVDGRLYLAPNLELVFPDEGSYFSFNADLHYLLSSHGRLSPWVGGGLGIYARGHDGRGRDTSVGANLIGGLGLRTELDPYVRLKVVLKGDTEVVLGFGIRF
jgi:hypothetical protein